MDYVFSVTKSDATVNKEKNRKEKKKEKKRSINSSGEA